MERIIYIIRHGLSRHNQQDVLSGTTNVAISTKGLKQAGQLSGFFKRKKIETVFSSPLIRARQTASVIFPEFSSNMVISEGLAEMDYGKYEGFQRLNYLSTDDPIIKLWLTQPSKVVFPGGSSVSTHSDKAYATFCEIAENHRNGNIAMISHRTTIRMIIARLLCMDLDNFRLIPCSTASVTIIKQIDQDFYVDVLNLSLSYFDKQ